MTPIMNAANELFYGGGERYIKPLTWVSVFLGLASFIVDAHAQDTPQKTNHPAEAAISGSDPKKTRELAFLEEADALIREGNPGAAYELLQPLEFMHAGEERFDYLLGIAALDSGRPDKATFAFERVLTVNPNSVAARLDMARAYFQLGDMPRARTEFMIVSKQDISAAARANIEKYLDEISVRESGGNTRLAGYVEGALGRDSNANSATDQPQILVNSIPATVPLSPANLGTPDSYRSASAGGGVRHKLDSNWGLYVSGDGRKRYYNSHTQFDTLGLNTRTGVAYGAKTEHLQVNILDGRNYLGGLHSYNTSGLSGEWRHAFSPGNQAGILIQQINYRYADVVMQPNDFNQQTMGLGWTHVSVDGKTNFAASLYRGKEKDVSVLITTATPAGGRADGAKLFSGFRIGGKTAVTDDVMLFAGGGVQTGNYEKVNSLFLVQRKDRYSDLTAGANWNFSKRWTLRPQLNYSKNSSNIVIYSFTRRDVSLTVRRDFR